MFTDTEHRKTFKRAVFEICSTNFPTRSELKKIGEEAARQVGRKRPWGGSHIYTLIHFDKWPKYGISKDLFRSVVKLAGMEAKNGKKTVEVLADGVRPGSIVLARSRKCNRRRCKIHFVPVTPNQIYCSEGCATYAALYRRKTNKRRRK